jgi:hypothetical protein
VIIWGDSTRRCSMVEATLTRIRWTPTRKAATVLDFPHGGDAIELSCRHGLSQAQLFA